MKFNAFLVLSALAYCSSLVLAVPVDGYLITREISSAPSGDIEAREVSNASASNIAARSIDSDDLERRDAPDETLVAREPQLRYGGRAGRGGRGYRRRRRRRGGRGGRGGRGRRGRW